MLLWRRALVPFVSCRTLTTYKSLLPSKAEEIFVRHLKRRQEIYDLLSKPDQDHGALGKELSLVGGMASLYEDLLKAREEELSLVSLERDAKDDAEMRALVRAEHAEIAQKLEVLEGKMIKGLAPVDETDMKDVVLEVRAGAGGLEASLFAMDLYEMYRKASKIYQWKFDDLDIKRSDAGGFKEASASIEGNNVYKVLKFETGVHRVQRVPATEAQGRTHTSTATVAVLPAAQEIEIDINPADLRIDTFKSQGCGGQSVNTTDSAVRIVHLPTNTVVTCQDERSQHRNKDKAMTVLRARLLDMERSAAAAERSEERRAQLGTGERSERIRTYNFPQDRITDHRIGLTMNDMGAMLRGELLPKMHMELHAAQSAAFLRSLED